MLQEFNGLQGSSETLCTGVLYQGLKDPMEPSAQGSPSPVTTGIPVTPAIPGIQVTQVHRCPIPGSLRTLGFTRSLWSSGPQ